MQSAINTLDNIRTEFFHQRIRYQQQYLSTSIVTAKPIDHKKMADEFLQRYVR